MTNNEIKDNDLQDHPDARSRLVTAALRLFAEKGYEAASTREICIAAGANISAIRYYFGDKAGLYHAAFTEPLGCMPCRTNRDIYPTLPLSEALNLFFSDFLDPLKMGPDINLVMKLRFREMTEPTGAWRQEVEDEIKPQHDALVALLKQHLGLSRVDLDVHRLAFAIISMAVYYYLGQEVVNSIAPKVLQGAKSIDMLAMRLSGYAESLISGEIQRRKQERKHGET
jgi:TetR/AcrR family transcriptional regulator, regulator of cefoperazone and chloramphenicol sensitivity